MKSRRGGNDRGGIRKRGGPTRTDRDGDMDMDASGSRVKKTRPDGGRSALGGRVSGAGAGGRAAGSGNRTQARDKNVDLIQRAIASTESQANIRQSKRNAGKPKEKLEMFSVRGWKDSKASTNKDEGREALVAFLERRMNSFTKSGPRIRITQVSPTVTITVTNIKPRQPPLPCPLVFEDGPPAELRSTLLGFWVLLRVAVVFKVA